LPPEATAPFFVSGVREIAAGIDGRLARRNDPNRARRRRLRTGPDSCGFDPPPPRRPSFSVDSIPTVGGPLARRLRLGRRTVKEARFMNFPRLVNSGNTSSPNARARKSRRRAPTNAVAASFVAMTHGRNFADFVVAAQGAFASMAAWDIEKIDEPILKVIDSAIADLTEVVDRATWLRTFLQKRLDDLRPRVAAREREARRNGGLGR